MLLDKSILPFPSDRKMMILRKLLGKPGLEFLKGSRTAYLRQLQALVEDDDSYDKRNEKAYQVFYHPKNLWVVQLLMLGGMLISFAWVMELYVNEKHYRTRDLRDLPGTALEGEDANIQRLYSWRSSSTVALLFLSVATIKSASWKLCDLICAVAFIIPVCCIVADKVITRHKGASISIQLMFYVLGFNMMSFPQTMIVGFLVLVVNCAALLQYDFEQGLVLSEIVVYGYSWGFGIVGAYWLEVLNRRNYILRCIYNEQVMEMEVFKQSKITVMTKVRSFRALILCSRFATACACNHIVRTPSRYTESTKWAKT
jgi:hypothetical protein